VLRLEQHGEAVTVVVHSSAGSGMARTGSDVRHRPGPTHVEHRSLSAALGPMDTGLSRRARVQWRNRRGATRVTSSAASTFQHETFRFSLV
jgi:hypothetical protein